MEYLGNKIQGNGNPLQCSCLENPRDGEAWWAAVYGVAQSRTRLKRLSSSSSSIPPQTQEVIEIYVIPESHLRRERMTTTQPSFGLKTKEGYLKGGGKGGLVS